jgi:hypothetical protein
MSLEFDEKQPVVKEDAKSKKRRQQLAKQAEIAQRIINAARNQNGIDDLSEEDIRVPLSVHNSDFDNLLRNTKKRYYKRTKKHTPFKSEVLQEAKNRGINKYVKFSKNLTTKNAILNAAQRKSNESKSKLEARKIKSKNTSKAKRAAERVTKEVSRGTLKSRVRQALVNEGHNNVSNDDIIVPLKAINSNLDKLVIHARKRYFKRTKKHTPKQANVLARAANQGIEAKYVKFRKEYKSNEEVLQAALVRKGKEDAKSAKPLLRQAILDHARDTLKLDSKQVRTLICAKEKK